MVCSPTINGHKKHFTSVELKRLTETFTKRVTPSDQCKKVAASFMAGTKQQLETEGLSRWASDFVINAKRKDTQKNYKSACNK